MVEGGPRETPKDDQDGHRHRVLILFDDGTGVTSIDGGDYFLPHAHNITGWTVEKQNVAGRESAHPGTLYPPGTLAAPKLEEQGVFSRAFARMLTPTEGEDDGSW